MLMELNVVATKLEILSIETLSALPALMSPKTANLTSRSIFVDVLVPTMTSIVFAYAVIVIILIFPFVLCKGAIVSNILVLLLRHHQSIVCHWRKMVVESQTILMCFQIRHQLS